MEIQKLNALKILCLMTAPILFTACGQNPAAPEAQAQGQDKVIDEVDGTVKSTVVLGKVGALRKTSTINLNKLVLTAISSSTPADTVRDTSAISGNDQVTVLRVLSLRPLRNWTITAKSVDMKDSIIHSGVTGTFYVKPADTVAVSLNLGSRFSMYEAHFNNLPDSVSASQTGTGKDKLNLNRMVLKIDGVIKADSLKADGVFQGGQNVSVYFDYVTPGNHTVTLEAYGTMHSYSGVLYSGASSFSVEAGIDDAKQVTLNWVGPTTGNGKITVVLGRVGKVILTGGMSGAIL